MDKNENSKKKTGLIAPWIDYYRQIQALFREDSEVRVLFDEIDYHIKIFVDNAIKADALSKLLPEEKKFGNITVKISVIPSNDLGHGPEELVQLAFNGNPALESIQIVDTPFGKETFVIFAKKVVQYYSDDMGDYFGLQSTLYENLARDILQTKGIHYCTNDL